LEIEEGSVLESGLLGLCNRGEKLEIRTCFNFGGKHYDEILITLIGVQFGQKNLKLILGRAAREANTTK